MDVFFNLRTDEPNSIRPRNNFGCFLKEEQYIYVIRHFPVAMHDICKYYAVEYFCHGCDLREKDHYGLHV